MTATQLFQSVKRWRVCLAFVCAMSLHVGAVALARNYPGNAPPIGDYGWEVPVNATDNELIEQPLEQVDTQPVPDPITAPPEDESFVVEEQKPQPAIARRPKKPVIANLGIGVARQAQPGSGRAMALAAPLPEYPYEARRQRLTGSGAATLTLDLSGNVVDVTMVRSTGSQILDNAALRGFQRWRFKPGTGSRVQVPITFLLTGPAY